MAQPPNPFLQGLAAAESGDFARAEGIARAMLARDPNDVSGLQIMGFSYFRQGQNGPALQAFLRANQIAPGQPALLYWLGVLYKERGALSNAERAFSDAVRIQPKYGEALSHLGETQYYLDKKAVATTTFERAVAAEPESPTVLAKAARHFERVHDLVRAREFAEKALAIAPDHEIAMIALAEVDLRDRRHAEIIERIAPYLQQGTNNERNASRLAYVLASAYDAVGEYSKAYDAYLRSNMLTGKMNEARIREENSPLTTVNIKRSTRFFESENLDEWPVFDSPAGDAPVFLLGFVRSGTTWLDQVLSSHPDIVVMEEEDNFVDAWREFSLSDSGLNNLKNASPEKLNGLRAAYWARAKASLREDPGGRLVVDKVPLNTAQLGLIHRMFPESKIIFAIRDPRDVAFSAFQQHFELNYAMYQFLNLETTVAYYDLIMSFGMLMREKMRSAIYDIRYEDVVADLESEARKLAEFLGLPWNKTMLTYDETAKRRAVRTTSANQVIKRPYSSSIGKWRRYEEQMKPILPVLAPWVERFGYEPD